MPKRMRREWPARRRTIKEAHLNRSDWQSRSSSVIAKGVIFGCLVVAMSGGTWTIGRAAEDPGEAPYRSNCSRCHGPEGRGAQGPNLIPFNWSYEKALDLIRHPVCE